MKDRIVFTYRCSRVFLAVALVCMGARTVWPQQAVGIASQPTTAAASPIILKLDAADAPHKILRARMIMPAASGPLALVYPKWIPGEHGPTGPIVNLSGMKIVAGGKQIPWRRDDADMYAFKCEVPAGVDSVE